MYFASYCECNVPHTFTRLYSIAFINRPTKHFTEKTQKLLILLIVTSKEPVINTNAGSRLSLLKPTPIVVSSDPIVTSPEVMQVVIYLELS